MRARDPKVELRPEDCAELLSVHLTSPPARNGWLITSRDNVERTSHEDPDHGRRKNVGGREVN